MIKNLFSTVTKNAPVIITTPAWNKMRDILKKREDHAAIMFSAVGGGCNGFNYKLETIDTTEFNNLQNEKIKPIIIENDKINFVVEPLSEMLVMGTTIDFITEDYSKNIFENKFTFTPQKDLATSCGCGISFALK